MKWVKVDAVLHSIFDPAIVIKKEGMYAGAYFIKSEFIKFHIPEGKRYAHEGFYIVREDQLNQNNKHKR